jgi:putative membrane protein
MRYAYIALIVLVTGGIAVFMVQNLSSVTVSFLNLSATLPLSLLAILLYILGMLTGGALVSLIRKWIEGARRA